MAKDDENGSDDDRPSGLRFGISAGFLSDLLEGLVQLDVDEGSTPPADSIDWSTSDERSDDARQRREPPRRKRTKRVRQPEADCLLDTRIEDDEFVVLADIPGADIHDLTVGIHPGRNALVIGQGDAVVARVPLPWESAESTKTAFNNGILEVRLRPTEA